MSEYNDTNVGVGSAYESEEEKEITRLENRLKQRDMQIAKLKAENARLQKLVDDCAPFLEDGETPEESLCRYDTNYANLWHSIEAKK